MDKQSKGGVADTRRHATPSSALSPRSLPCNWHCPLDSRVYSQFLCVPVSVFVFVCECVCGLCVFVCEYVVCECDVCVCVVCEWVWWI